MLHRNSERPPRGMNCFGNALPLPMRVPDPPATITTPQSAAPSPFDFSSISPIRYGTLGARPRPCHQFCDVHIGNRTGRSRKPRIGRQLRETIQPAPLWLSPAELDHLEIARVQILERR